VKPKVVVAETIAQAGIDALAESCEVDVAVGAGRDELMARLADASGLVVRSATDVDREMLLAAPMLKVVGRAGIGVDNIDLATATERGVLVVNAPHANTISAAEHTMALLLSQARSIPQAHAKLVAGDWDRKSFQGVELHGKTLGVIGLGKIGTMVAQRCLAFGMKVVAYDPFVSAERARRLDVELVELDDMFPQVDFITIHLPKTKETEGLLGKDNLARCKEGVRIVNTSRGGIIDEAALAEAIRSGHVAGAGIDVFATEPTTDSPLFELPQVVVTPHLGASTAEAQDKAGTDTAEAVAAALRGELVLTAVNIDLGREVSEDVQAFLPLAEQLGKAFVGLTGGMSGRVVLRAEGRLATQELRPLKLALLKGALSGYSTEPVSYVNAPSIAEQRGLIVDLESSEEAEEYVSCLRISDGTASLAGTMSRKGTMMVEILGHDVELPFSDHVLIVRNSDTPGVIGRVGTYLGELRVNIANMVVGRSRVTGEAAMMGINVDQPLGDDQLAGLRRLEGIEEARYLDLGVRQSR
jgi:D-3-phosphoglycerate dehydrogenase / 2-oxoglutarate reductase